MGCVTRLRRTDVGVFTGVLGRAFVRALDTSFLHLSRGNVSKTCGIHKDDTPHVGLQTTAHMPLGDQMCLCAA